MRRKEIVIGTGIEIGTETEIGNAIEKGNEKERENAKESGNEKGKENANAKENERRENVNVKGREKERKERKRSGEGHPDLHQMPGDHPGLLQKVAGQKKRKGMFLLIHILFAKTALELDFFLTDFNLS